MKTAALSRIVVALLFALAIVAAAALLKGTSASLPVQTALLGCALSFAVLRRPVCLR